MDRVAGELRRELLAGRPVAGAYLPPERELAARHRVNRLTLRAALERLAAEGLVEPRHGAGSRVLALREAATLEVLPHLVGSRDPALLRGFLELRRTIAAEAVALAAVHATEEDLARLEALRVAQEDEKDPRSFAARDLAFGRAVLRCSGNLAFELLLNSVEKAYLAAPWLHQALHADPGLVRGSYASVLALLRGRDPELARVAVREALAAIDEAALARLAAPAGRAPGVPA